MLCRCAEASLIFGSCFWLPPHWPWAVIASYRVCIAPLCICEYDLCKVVSPRLPIPLELAEVEWQNTLVVELEERP